jgi:uncharacterized membrane-anchored protein
VEKSAAMKNPIKSVFLHLILVLPMCWCLSAMAAEKVPAATHVPLESMTQTEYENYRSQLNQQVNGVTVNTPATEKASGQSEEEDPEAKKNEKDQSGSGGYGKGYRARMERNTRTGRTGGYRGGSMSRGGGRNR